jgi:hypothetical protein
MYISQLLGVTRAGLLSAILGPLLFPGKQSPAEGDAQVLEGDPAQ